MNRRLVSLVLLSALVTAACGTRREEADFLAGASTALGTSTAVDGGAGTRAESAAGPQAAGADVPAEGSAPAGPVAGGDAATGDGESPRVDPSSGPAAPGARPAVAAPGPGAPSKDVAGAPAAADAPNSASDIGVTSTTIKLGNVISIKGLAGPDQFPPYYYGAAAYFKDLNARGGINGRKVVLETCDDEFSATGNQRCTRDFVDKSKVFAFVANACGTCDGTIYADEKGVPAVGGLTTDFRSYALKHYWSGFPNPYPQNGKIGWKGKIYNSTSTYRFFKEKYGVKTAGIVYYDNAAPSKNAAFAIAEAMKKEGLKPFLYGLNVALPQYDSAVLDMKSRGVTAIWDSIDITGNQNLCKSIDSNGLKLTAKVSTSAAWVQKVGKTFSSPCRNAIFSAEVPGSVPFTETSNPEIARFRAAMERSFPSKRDEMHQWSVDGWAGAMRFADAALPCGANLTRACLEKNLDAAGEYTARGLWFGRSNRKVDFDKVKTRTECISVVQWSDAAGTWVTRGALKDTCYTTPLVGVTLS